MTIRKDKKGRKLFTGESQRKDGRYMYRYTDRFGKRRTIYADDLTELREKEQADEIKGAMGKADSMTIADLVEAYYFFKTNLKRTTCEVNQNTLIKVDRPKERDQKPVHRAAGSVSSSLLL